MIISAVEGLNGFIKNSIQNILKMDFQDVEDASFLLECEAENVHTFKMKVR